MTSSFCSEVSLTGGGSCLYDDYVATIYGLFDPRKPLHLWEVRYIGQTTKTAQGRLNEHIDGAKRNHTRPSEKWIRKLATEGVRPVAVAFEHVDVDHLDDRERAWIAEGRRQGWRLLNVTDGGGGMRGFRHTDEAKKRISEAGRGKVHPPRTDEWRERQRAAKVGKKQPPEAVAKTAAANRGKKRSPETGAKIAAANRLRVVTDDTKAKISRSKTGVPNPKLAESLRGRPLSEEHKQRIGEAVRANPPSEEGRQRMLEAARLRPSDETKAKMSAARSAWWERKKQINTPD